MRKELSKDYLVIEEGLNGRTTVWEDPIEGYKSGKQYLIPCLETHKPLNLVIIMLGTNDLKARFSATAYDIAEGAGTLVEMVSKSETGVGGGPPEVLLVTPPPTAEFDEYSELFVGAGEKSQKLSGEFRRVAEELDCELLDGGEYINSSDLDGIHLEEKEHRRLGEVIANRAAEILRG